MEQHIEVPPPRQGIPGSWDSNGLRLPPGLDHAQWESIGQTIRYFERNVMWWLGDWWNYGERAYGDMASQAAQDHVKDITGHDYHTVRSAAYVAARFENERRRTNLPFSHHREVAALPPCEQDEWLDTAEAQRWSRNDLRNALRGDSPEGVDVLQQVTCPRCGYEWEAAS